MEPNKELISYFSYPNKLNAPVILDVIMTCSPNQVIDSLYFVLWLQTWDSLCDTNIT
jgi:hypothetical protein